MKTAVLIIIASVLISFQASAWSDHFIFTKISEDLLKQRYPILDKPVQYSALSDFISENSIKIKEMFIKFYTFKDSIYPYEQWILTRENKAVLNSDQPLTDADFKSLLGVQNTAFNDIQLSERFKSFYGEFSVLSDTVKPFGTWLSLFSDEPDWGADKYLFNNSDPRYGKIPFGDPQKLSSQGPFHLYYMNESSFFYKFQPDMKQCMTHLRFIAFLELADIAASVKNPFWTSRFLGNAIHYLQDVTVPYHSRVAPNMTLFTYISYFTSADKQQFMKEKTQLLSNRHLLYEDLFMSILFSRIDSIDEFLPEARSVVSRMLNARGRSFLSQDSEKCFEKFKILSEKAYKHAKKVDDTVEDIFPEKLVNDSSYDPYDDPEFDIFEYFNENMQNYAKKEKKFLKEFRCDFLNTVEATSFFISEKLDMLM